MATGGSNGVNESAPTQNIPHLTNETPPIRQINITRFSQSQQLPGSSSHLPAISHTLAASQPSLVVQALTQDPLALSSSQLITLQALESELEELRSNIRQKQALLTSLAREKVSMQDVKSNLSTKIKEERKSSRPRLVKICTLTNTLANLNAQAPRALERLHRQEMVVKNSLSKLEQEQVIITAKILSFRRQCIETKISQWKDLRAPLEVQMYSLSTELSHLREKHKTLMAPVKQQLSYRKEKLQKIENKIKQKGSTSYIDKKKQERRQEKYYLVYAQFACLQAEQKREVSTLNHQVFKLSNKIQELNKNIYLAHSKLRSLSVASESRYSLLLPASRASSTSQPLKARDSRSQSFSASLQKPNAELPSSSLVSLPSRQQKKPIYSTSKTQVRDSEKRLSFRGANTYSSDSSEDDD